MKRQSYRSPNTRGRRGVVVGTILVVVILVLIFILRLFAPGAFFSMATPLWSLGDGISNGLTTLTTGFSSNKKLAAQNASLALENEALKNENAVLTARAQDLTKLLGGTSVSHTEQFPAGVLAHPPESPYDTLIIDVGSNDGAHVGAIAYAPGGVPIGSLKHVYADTAQVSLYTSPGRTTDGWIGANRVPITLTGAGSGAFTASLAQSAPVQVGDTVYAPGPGALPIGTLVKINTDPSSPSETLLIQPFVNLFSITWVEVDKNGS